MVTVMDEAVELAILLQRKHLPHGCPKPPRENPAKSAASLATQTLLNPDRRKPECASAECVVKLERVASSVLTLCQLSLPHGDTSGRTNLPQGAG
jgi:hypothetical protein